MTVETDDHSVRETCPDCGYETAHRVTIQIRAESPKAQNASFSREPYRVSACDVCGNEDVRRMNNA